MCFGSGRRSVLVAGLQALFDKLVLARVVNRRLDPQVLELNPTIGKALCSGFVPTTCFGAVHPPSRSSRARGEGIIALSQSLPKRGDCRQRALETLSQVGEGRILADFSPHFPPLHLNASCPRTATPLTPHLRLSRRRRSRRRPIALFILRLRPWGRQPRRSTRRRTRTRSSHPHRKSLEHSTKNTHTSVICKLTRICRIPELLQVIRSVSVAMRQVQLEGCISPISTFSGASTMERTCLASSKCSSNAAVRPRSGTLSLEIELRPHPRIQTSTEPVCSTGLVERTRQRTHRSALSTQTT